MQAQYQADRAAFEWLLHRTVRIGAHPTAVFVTDIGDVRLGAPDPNTSLRTLVVELRTILVLGHTPVDLHLVTLASEQDSDLLVRTCMLYARHWFYLHEDMVFLEDTQTVRLVWTPFARSN